jgi:hypothetical protein
MREHYPPETVGLFREILHYQSETRGELLDRRSRGRARIRRLVEEGAKVAFWGIGWHFSNLMEADLVAPANVYLVDRRPGGFYGKKPVEDPEVVRREGIETVVIPSAYRGWDGRIPAEEIRRELENDFGVKTIVSLDEFFL